MIAIILRIYTWFIDKQKWVLNNICKPKSILTFFIFYLFLITSNLLIFYIRRELVSFGFMSAIKSITFSLHTYVLWQLRSNLPFFRILGYFELLQPQIYIYNTYKQRMTQLNLISYKKINVIKGRLTESCIFGDVSRRINGSIQKILIKLSTAPQGVTLDSGFCSS